MIVSIANIMTGGEFLDQLSKYQLIKNSSIPRSYL